MSNKPLTKKQNELLADAIRLYEAASITNDTLVSSLLGDLARQNEMRQLFRQRAAEQMGLLFEDLRSSPAPSQPKPESRPEHLPRQTQ